MPPSDEGAGRGGSQPDALAIHNERVKLLAGLLNAMAGSSYAIGVAAPVAATFFFGAGSGSLRPGTVVVGAGVWLAIASVLHLGAQRALRGLRK